MASQTMHRSMSGARRRARNAAPPVSRDGIRRDYLYYSCAALFFITLLLSIALVKYGFGGLPLRAMTAMAILGLIGLTSPGLLVRAVQDIRTILGIIAACAAIGIMSSLINGMPAADLGRQILEIHVQAAVSVVVGACLVRVCGPRMVFYIFAAAIGLTTFVAFLQFLHFNPAWALRDTLQRMQPLDMGDESVFLTRRLRAMGLSFSPVHLGTQLCLLFAVGFAARAVEHKDLLRSFDKPTALLLAFFLFGSIVSGNRSPLIGAVLFIVFYLFLVRPAIAVILTVTLLPFVVFLDDIMLTLADLGWRVARTDDGSSAGRAVLRAFGSLLFLARPYGYGLSFDSVEYWHSYWDTLKNYENPLAMTLHALHNYYLMILNKYGALILVLAGFAIYKMRSKTLIALAFTPYAAHIFYHNDGPFQGDFIIWYIMPIFTLLYPRVTNDRARRPRRSPKPARRPLTQTRGPAALAIEEKAGR